MYLIPALVAICRDAQCPAVSPVLLRAAADSGLVEYRPWIGVWRLTAAGRAALTEELTS